MTLPFEAACRATCGALRRSAWVFALACLSVAHAQDAASLKARHLSLQDRLSSNAFQRPLVLESSESDGVLKGDIYALIEQPFAVVGPALQGAGHWCDILILHINVKRCLASGRGASGAGAVADRLSLNIGRKVEQAPDDAYRFEFDHRLVSSQTDYLQVALQAEQGPLGTSRYRVMLEVVALDARRSFVHLSYSYAYGVAARVAAQGYLSTVGRDKVGFSVVGHRPDGTPTHIGGMRGVVERNTMRYYLAVESYLGALSAPASQQVERRLNAWHAGVERYPTQLHELELREYLDMKRKEIQRQSAPAG